MELNEKITNAILAKREEVGMSRYELAKKSGLTYQRLTDIEKGGSMTIKTVESLFEVLGLELIIRDKEI